MAYLSYDRSLQLGEFDLEVIFFPFQRVQEMLLNQYLLPKILILLCFVYFVPPDDQKGE